MGRVGQLLPKEHNKRERREHENIPVQTPYLPKNVSQEQMAAHPSASRTAQAARLQAVVATPFAVRPRRVRKRCRKSAATNHAKQQSQSLAGGSGPNRQDQLAPADSNSAAQRVTLPPHPRQENLRGEVEYLMQENRKLRELLASQSHACKDAFPPNTNISKKQRRTPPTKSAQVDLRDVLNQRHTRERTFDLRHTLDRSVPNNQAPSSASTPTKSFLQSKQANYSDGSTQSDEERRNPARQSVRSRLQKPIQNHSTQRERLSAIPEPAINEELQTLVRQAVASAQGTNRTTAKDLARRALAGISESPFTRNISELEPPTRFT